MAHSILTFGTRSAIFSDPDLILLTCFLYEEVMRDPKTYGSLVQPVQTWKQNLAGAGPGTIELDLDAALSSPLAVSGLGSALNAVRSRIAGYGSHLPGSVLHGPCEAPRLQFDEYPVPELVAAVERLEALLKD